MSTLFNSHQNININISYNLGHKKVSKSLLAKKNMKNNKTTTTKNPNNNIKIKKPHNSQKQEKDIIQINKLTKTKKNVIKNLQIPDYQPQKRYKTQVQQYAIPSHKKELTSIKLNNRPTTISQNNDKIIQFGGISKINNKKNTKTKIKKSHNKSCMLYSSKKPIIDTEVLLSSVLPIAHQRRKRAQSSTQIQTKNDKIVSKLLNMSLLCSEIGGSEFITQKKQEGKFQKVLKQFISSLDMNMIHHMNEDKEHQLIQTKNKYKNSNIIQYLLSIKHYSMIYLNEKAIKIQRYWRKKMKKQVINYYSDLFKKVIYNHTIGKQDLSIIEQNQQNNSEIIDIRQKIRNNQHMDSFQQEDSLTFQEDNNFKLNIQNHSIEQQNQQKNSLNLPRYRQLIKKQKKQNDIVKFKQQQVNQWNTINKMISSNFKSNNAVDPKLLDQLIKQSVLQKKWMEIQNQNQQQISQKRQQPQKKLKQQQIVENHLNKHDLDNISQEKQQKIEDLEESQQYNWNKYTQEHQDKDDWDAKWIKRQLVTDNGVMKNYLDCGLDGFGVMMEDQNAHFTSYDDEPIGLIYERQQQSRDKIMQHQQVNNQQDIFQIEKQLEQQIAQNQQDISKRNIILLQYVLQYLMQDVAQQIADILQKNSKNTLNNQPNKKIRRGIPTNFSIIKQYLTKLKKYIISNESISNKVIVNLNRQLGPTSLQILSYLRIDTQQQIQQLYQQDCDDDQDQLYVVPISTFQQFQMELQSIDYKNQQNRQYYKKVSAFINFFHRAIFQCFNECLDFEKPYGILGRPYQWTTQPRLPKVIKHKDLQKVINNAINRLLQLTSVLSGIIFQKQDSPFANTQLQQQHKQQINQQRLSRMLANQLFDTEQTWITYNDQIAQLLVEVSKAIQKRIFFEICADIKRINRRRGLFLIRYQREQQNFQLNIQ